MIGGGNGGGNGIGLGAPLPPETRLDRLAVTSAY